MRRREFITLLGGAAVGWPLAARAQQGERMRRIGVLMSFSKSDPEAQAFLSAFVQALAPLGWTDGRNVRIDTRWAGSEANQLKAHAVELVGLKPDAILVAGTLGLLALRQETRSIPIVFVQVGDPVASGLVASLARPGGNITGFTTFEHAMGGKWLEVLKEIAPRISRVLVILSPENATHPGLLRALETAAPSSGVQVTAARVRDAGDIERAVNAFAPGPDAGLIVLPDAVTFVHRDLIVASAARRRLPAIYAFRHFAKSGGLMSYGYDPVDLYRRAASYVDRILKGATPADLPIQAPTKFELVINLKTAKALGLKVSESFLLRADEVIE
jgi:putative ABC transport system substrate-binding protein